MDQTHVERVPGLRGRQKAQREVAPHCLAPLDPRSVRFLHVFPLGRILPDGELAPVPKPMADFPRVFPLARILADGEMASFRCGRIEARAKSAGVLRYSKACFRLPKHGTPSMGVPDTAVDAAVTPVDDYHRGCCPATVAIPCPGGVVCPEPSLRTPSVFLNPRARSVANFFICSGSPRVIGELAA